VRHSVYTAYFCEKKLEIIAIHVKLYSKFSMKNISPQIFPFVYEALCLGSYAASGGHYQQTLGEPWLLHLSPVELITATAFCTVSLHKSSVDFRWT